jgi:leader peptidase (prepilin peptidase)/N-methyltransferase
VVFRGLTATAFAYSFFVAIGVWLSAYDLRWRVLPNRILVPSTGVGLVLLVVAVVVERGDTTVGDVLEKCVRVALGGVVLFSVFLALALISPRGMGMGDVKLAGFVGMFLAFDGWQTLVLGAAGGFICAAVAGLVVLAARRTGPLPTIPFCPMMILGALIALVM